MERQAVKLAIFFIYDPKSRKKQVTWSTNPATLLENKALSKKGRLGSNFLSISYK